MVILLKDELEQAVGFTIFELFYIAIGVFTVMILALISAMLFLMLAKSKVAASEKQLQPQFKQWLVSIILQEYQSQELPFDIPIKLASSLHRSFPRRVLLNELVNLKRNLSGQSGENLLRLYRQLRLEKLSKKDLHSRKWFQKAKGIQELAVMEQQDCLPEIAALMNHPNPIVRMEAQLAMVQLQQYKGMYLFENLFYPLTEWHQVKLLQLLAHQPIPDPDMIRSWLQSANPSVVQVALKLIAEQHAGQYQQEVIACLSHSSEPVRHQAIVCLGETPSESAALALRAHYTIENKKALQSSILNGLNKIGSLADLEFLKKI